MLGTRVRITISLILALPLSAAVFPPGVSQQDIPRLLESTAWVRSLEETAVVKLVPERSGLHFVGCPNCNAGRQEGQLTWSPQRPDEISCRYCKHRYPSAKYPTKDAVTVRNPRDETQRYPYWADSTGYRYFFEARRDDLIREYLANSARELAQLYVLTNDAAYARRAALILDRFAQVFPGWCYHYDYPFQQKIIYEGAVAPAQFRPGFRTARWTWWAYMDIPVPLLQAYDWIRDSGALPDPARIERDLFRNAADQVAANPETNGNMSPTTWGALVRLGRIIDEARYITEVKSRLQHFLQTRFFYDGVWPEGAPSYHAQTIGNLARVLDLLGKSNEPIAQSQAALRKMRLPNGRPVPVHDTWSTDRREPIAETKPYLLPALGHACLGGGRGDAQSQFHMTWSGGYGHQHADNLSLIVFAHGRELLSDLGYTHTRARAWTLATASHNTVVIDGRNQARGSEAEPSDGNLRWFDADSVSADGRRGYRGIARVYRRTLYVIDVGGGRRFAVDVFEVEGGRLHDYILHGDADIGGKVDAPLPLDPMQTLLPAGFAFKPAENEGQASLSAQQYWAYGYFRQLRAAAAAAGAPLPVTFRSRGGVGLRVTLFPESNTTLVLGENPAIRGAQENDAGLDQFTRPFLMLRREAAGTRSVFISVLEPFQGEPFIHSVERLAPAKLRINTDTGHRIVEYRADVAYERFPLQAIESGTLVLAGTAASLPAPGEVVRLLTADGWIYPYHVTEAAQSGNRVRIHVAEGPSMVFDGDLRLTAYPQRAHAGPAEVDWLKK
jgi:hypothetical protein